MISSTRNSKRLLLIGGSGFIGSAIGEHFARLGWEIRVLTRTIRRYQLAFPCVQFLWDGQTIPVESISGVDAVINLAGQGIADHVWSAAYRRQILDSRVNSTKALAAALAGLDVKPSVIVQASAVGYYGMQGRAEPCDEVSQPGSDFLSDVCQAWETEAHKIGNMTRLCVARIGLVLGWEGGALPQLWDIYASAMGSSLGSGRQWMNWIHIDDIVQFFARAVLEETYSGVYNLVAPENVENQAFHKLLADRSPSFRALWAPGFCLRAVMGGRATLVLSAPCVASTRLSKAGFKFKFSSLSQALADLFTERAHPKVHYLKAKQWVPLGLDAVWDFVSSAENLERITPPMLGFRIKDSSTPHIEEGTCITYALKLHGFPLTWRSHISKWAPKTEFVDEQEKGPYRIWFHRHVFTELAGGTLIEDRIDYALPMFPLGQVALPFVKKDLARIFCYRKEATASILCSPDALNVISQT